MSAFSRSRFVVLSTAALLGVTVLTARADEKIVEPTPKVEKILGAPCVKLLHGCTKVECFRISPEITTEAGAEYIDGYRIIGRGKEIGKDFAVRVTNILFAEATYTGLTNRCFEPGVVFRVWCDKEWVDVVVCFKCTDLALFDTKAKGFAEAHGGFGATVSETALIRCAKEAFPDDKVIQGLVEPKK